MALVRALPAAGAWMLTTEASEGDHAGLGRGGANGGAVDRVLAPLVAAGLLPPWPLWRLRQVHGARVVVADPRRTEVLEEGDAVVLPGPGSLAAVVTADCVPLALAAAGQAVAVVHVGWRGLVAGVVQAAVAALAALDPGPVSGALGPAIGPCCYAFSEADLQTVEAASGGVGRSRTRSGQLALDLPAAVAATARAAGVELAPGPVPCTGCDGRFFSHRCRADSARQATVVWRGWTPRVA
ncbi:laccase domain-containing protein [Aciditerrimonas ferrireducens]|uniref:laccase domain-containing protein n=1 Tax=Aciditerrimonas ferrireducens TaxID=667306 RepID=UPI0020040954|nr:laccase domain-containing protein [Aciditerrimonas ferrireducens]MCK4178201.1 laccase domain-containing protein [Aciditerrimonas ferrireducens]